MEEQYDELPNPSHPYNNPKTLVWSTTEYAGHLQELYYRLDQSIFIEQ